MNSKSNAGRKKHSPDAKKQSRFMAQAIAIELRMSAVEWLFENKSDVYGSDVEKAYEAAHAALENFFEAAGLADSSFTRLESGSDRYISSTLVRRYYKGAFLDPKASEDDQEAYFSMMKSEEEAEASTSRAIKTLVGNYAGLETHLIRAFVVHFGVDRISEVIRSTMNNDFVGGSLVPINDYDAGDYYEVLKLHRRVYASTVRHIEADELTAEAIQELIKTNPDLQQAYKIVRKRMLNVIGDKLPWPTSSL